MELDFSPKWEVFRRHYDGPWKYWITLTDRDNPQEYVDARNTAWRGQYTFKYEPIGDQQNDKA